MFQLPIIAAFYIKLNMGAIVSKHGGICKKNKAKGEGVKPDILLKLSKHNEARILSSSSPFSRTPFNWEMMAKKAARFNPALQCVESEELNHATVVRHILTISGCLESKHLEIVFKNELSPSPTIDSNKFTNHSLILSSSFSYGYS